MKSTDIEKLKEACGLAVEFLIENIQIEKSNVDEPTEYPGVLNLSAKQVATIKRNCKANIIRLNLKVSTPGRILPCGEVIDYEARRALRRNIILERIVELSGNNIIRLKFLEGFKFNTAIIYYILKIQNLAIQKFKST
ncbi:MAG: hypothetical protein WCQ49_00435 [Candidatus Saccharibacteria bacterium]